MARRSRSNRAGATLSVLVLVISAFATMVVLGGNATAVSGSSATTLLHDDFTHDTSLNTSMWQINGPVGMTFGQDEVGVNVITLAPTFSSAGMMIDQINASQEEGTIQSIANFTPPFTATVTVEGTVSNGHTFGFAMTSADASSGITVYGNLNTQNCSHLGDCGDPSVCGVSANSAIPPNQCYYGIDAKVGTNGSSWTHHGKLYNTPSVNVVYTLQITVDASGNAWYAASQGGQLLGAVNQQVGAGPFWLIMYQGEGSPVESPGPNQAYWLSASVTPTFTPFSTTSTSPGPSASGIPIIWLIIIPVAALLFLIIFLWYRRRNLTIRVQDARTLSPVAEAVAAAEGPEKLQGYTDKNGKITFKDVKKGDYYIRAEAKGYVGSIPVKVEVKKTMEYPVKLERSVAGAPAAPGGNAPPGVPASPATGPGEGRPDMQGSVGMTQAPSPQLHEPQAAVAQPVPTGSAPAAPEAVPTPFQSAQGNEDEIGGLLGGRIGEIIKKFEEKGAVSPETALTAEELGLSRLFVRIMKRRQGRTRVFVEINGRYYLNRKALQESK